MKFFFDKYHFESGGALGSLTLGLAVKELWASGQPRWLAHQDSGPDFTRSVSRLLCFRWCQCGSRQHNSMPCHCAWTLVHAVTWAHVGAACAQSGAWDETPEGVALLALRTRVAQLIFCKPEHHLSVACLLQAGTPQATTARLSRHCLAGSMVPGKLSVSASTIIILVLHAMQAVCIQLLTPAEPPTQGCC